MWLKGFRDIDIIRCIHFLSQMNSLLQCKNIAYDNNKSLPEYIIIGVNQTKITKLMLEFESKIEQFIENSPVFNDQQEKERSDVKSLLPNQDMVIKDLEELDKLGKSNYYSPAIKYLETQLNFGFKMTEETNLTSES